ncbi:MAG: hypothetical protein ACTHKC_05840 [Candidatus Nitrosocosmicus sp.]
MDSSLQLSLVLIEAKEGNRREIINLLLSFVNPPRKREGNILYFDTSIISK